MDIDPETAEFYRNLPGALGDSLRQKMRQEDGAIYLTISHRRCPMWRQDGLCEIQCQLGHEHLSHTCREFPRLCHDYGDFIERGLELSCPAAAKLILSEEGQEIISISRPDGAPGDYDREAMDILLCSRDTLLAYWEECSAPLPHMLAITLLYSHEVQAQIDGGEAAVFDPDALLRRGKELALPGDMSGIVAFFKGLDILTPRWKARLNAPTPAAWPREIKYFVRYALLRHYLQAVSDYDLICRVKWIIISCLLLQHLGGDFIQTAQLFSKEIENSTDNMEAIFDGAYTAPAFTDRTLLGLLLF